jgi:hypothetical protein
MRCAGLAGGHGWPAAAVAGRDVAGATHGLGALATLESAVHGGCEAGVSGGEGGEVGFADDLDQLLERVGGALRPRRS